MASEVQIDFGWLHASLEERLQEIASQLTQGVAYVPPFRGEPIAAEQESKGRIFGLSLTHEEEGRISSSEAHTIDFVYEVGIRLGSVESGVSRAFGAVYSAAGVVSKEFRNWYKRDDPTDHTLSVKNVSIQCDLRGSQGDGAEEFQQAVLSIRGTVIRCVGSSQTQF